MRIPRSLLLPALAAGLLVAALPLGGPARAAFSGVNGELAYTCGSDVCVAAATSGATRTRIITGASDPVWSPDGKTLAWVDSAGGIDVATVSGTSVGTTTVVVAATTASTPGPGGSQPTWSNNGAQIGYVNATTHTIWVARVDGSDAVTGGSAVLQAGNIQNNEIDPAYSPDGTQLAFVRSVTGHDQVFTIDITGGAETTGDTPAQLTASTVGDNRHPNWSPDSNFIVYSSTQDAQPTALLYRMTFAGGAQTKLGTGIPGDMPQYSPDQTKVVYAVPTGATGAGNIQTVTVASAGTTGSPTTVDSTSGNADPDWQPTSFSGGGGSTTGPPVNATYPVVSLPFGSTSTQPVVGTTLSATAGTWNGAFPMTFTYQWKFCDASDPLNGSCFNIAGATSSFFTVPMSVYGKRLRVQVTATNGSGTVSQNSVATDVVTAIAPHLRATPPIVGQNMVDQTLSVSSGTWDGSTPLTITYAWNTCDPFGTIPSCKPIPGATSTTYVPKVADIGYAIRVFITATNAAGTETDFTNHTFPIVDKPHFAPSATAKPTLTPTAPSFGLPVTATIGAYSGDAPIATVLRWWRCDATGANCHIIRKLKKLEYTPGFADVGYTLRVDVTATNAYGKLVAQSDPTEPIAAPPPHVRGRRITGTAKADYLYGTRGDDVIEGLGGNDTILGNGGYDTIDGGAGNDVIRVTGPGTSHVQGGSGSDTIYAANGFKDVIDCGPGNDRAIVDSFDVVKNCEVVVTQPSG